MKCFLILLAIGLVISDKLDRTYLPPPGAKSSGGSFHDLQIPLEYLSKTFPKSTQNEQFFGQLQPEFPKRSNVQGVDSINTQFTPISSYSNDISKSMLYPHRLYNLNVPFGNPDVAQNILLAQKSLNMPYAYVPNLKSLATQQSYITPPSPKLSTTFRNTDLLQINNNEEPSHGLYFVPKADGSDKRNNISNVFESRNLTNNEDSLYWDQVNNKYSDTKTRTFKPTSGIADKESQNYIPSDFGFYGGTPMIMNIQTTIPESYKNMVSEAMKIDEVVVPHPFQTPLVGKKTQSAHKYNKTKMHDSSSNLIDVPETAVSAFLKENIPQLEQRNNAPVRSKLTHQDSIAELDKNAVIISYDSVVKPDSYSYSFNTSNGLHVHENGTAVNGVKTSGSYSYTGDDGKIYRITYTADENGFQPRGDHLPTPPPIPEAIKKVIEQAAINKAADFFDDGSYDESKYGHMNYENTLSISKNPIKSGFDNLNKKTSNKLLRPNDLKSPTDNTAKLNSKKFFKTQSKNNLRLPENLNELDNLRDQQHSSRLQQFKVNNSTQKQVLINSASNKNVRPSNSNSNIDSDIYYKKHEKVENSKYGEFSYTTDNVNLTSDPSFIKHNNEISQAAQSNTHIKDLPSSNYEMENYDTGYYYVPPIIKFDKKKTVNQQPDFFPNDNITSLTTYNTRAQVMTGDIFNRNSFADIKEMKYENDVDTDSITKPYVTRPQDLIRGNHNEDTHNQSVNPNETYDNSLPTYTNDFDSPFVYTSTSMPSQAKEKHESLNEASIPLNDNTSNQYLPQVVENRVNIPYGPDIRISQEFITSTYKPGLEGINLKVNQNVNVYGLGRPSATDAPDGNPQVTTYDEYFRSTSPNLNTGTYSDGIFGEQETNQRNLDFVSPIEFKTTEIPESRNFISDNFKYSPGQTLIFPTFSTESQVTTENIIGEDFSGPKQPQNYDTITGYYYK